jgi:C1A family cysteine protease
LFCRSWAFSTTGALEGAYKIAGNPLTSFSEQMLVSCDTSDGNAGCKGGYPNRAMAWIQSNGLCTEAAYPYTSGGGSNGSCETTCSPLTGIVSSHTNVPSNSEAALVKALTSRPVSVMVEADKSTFQLYKGGVLDDSSCGTNIDHAILAVGYGTGEEMGGGVIITFVSPSTN